MLLEKSLFVIVIVKTSTPFEKQKWWLDKTEKITKAHGTKGGCRYTFLFGGSVAMLN